LFCPYSFILHPQKMMGSAGNAPVVTIVQRRKVQKEGARKIKGRGAPCAPRPRHFNKEQTPLAIWLDTNPRFHGGSFGV
jgi:hypothetical protein